MLAPTGIGGVTAKYRWTVKVVQKNGNVKQAIYAIIDYLCNNTSSKILLHGLSFSSKIILSFVCVVLLQIIINNTNRPFELIGNHACLLEETAQ